MKRYEAWRVYEALQVSTLFSPPTLILQTCLPDVCCNLIPDHYKSLNLLVILMVSLLIFIFYVL
jgi:hypothetical protein